MARQSRAAELGLIALTIEGGLIAPEQVQKIIGVERTAKTAEAYGCPKGTNIGDEIARYFRIGQALWRDYEKAEPKTIARTAVFARDLLSQCLGFTDLAGPVEHQEGVRRYRLALEAKGGRVPIVVAAPVPGADAFASSRPEFGDGEGGRPKRSPTALLQDWLNANPAFYWGLVFAGDRVRLMRDNASLTRPAWIEADLGAMFRDEMFADFTAFWLLAHATRFGAEGAAASDCALEQWRDAGLKQGIEARADLRNNVEEALRELGQGLVEANPDLRERLETGNLTMQALFEELLRTVYRLIFLAVAEDRDLLHPRRATLAARQLYADGYAFSFWRDRSRRRVARDGHHDAWEAIKVTLASLEHGEELLGLPALGGLFSGATTPVLNSAIIPNRRFLAALFSLGYIRKDGITHRINWRDLKTEELGSVYESLLEIRPSLNAAGGFEMGSGAKGNDRKTSGSYYTPDSLVECLLESALDPVLDRAEASAATADDKAAAILALKVIDPACGSGHFLLGAARRMATRVARLRNEDAGKEETQTALRDVVSRCIHGVDRNPMAVELAKVALWIESVSPGQPLGFLDANLRCGDALLGVFDLKVLEDGIPDDAYKPLTGDDRAAARYYLQRNRDAKRGQGLLDFAKGGGVMPAGRIATGLGTIKAMPEDTVGQVEKKRAAFEAWKADPARWRTQVACDLYMAAFLLPKLEVPEAPGRAMVPTTAEVRLKLSGGNVYGPLEGAAIDAAWGAAVLHWPLEFPDVMLARGGFDVVLGNPPWEVIQLGEEEYFQIRAPEIADLKGASRKRAIAALEAERPEMFAEFARDKRTFEAMNEFARAGGRFDLTARGKINTYALFAEHFLNLTRAGGRAGVIVPTGIVTDFATSKFFAHIVSSRRLVSSLGFDNAKKIFPSIHPDTPFTLLTTGHAPDVAEFTAYILETDELQDARRHYSLTPAQIACINPNTKTAPVFRARRDAELTASIYDRVPVLIDEAKGKPGNPWGVEFRQGLFNMASDSGLFRTAAQLAADNWEREGTDWVNADARMVPLYEAKMIHQFDHRWATYDNSDSREMTLVEKKNVSAEVTPRYWVLHDEMESRLIAKGWNRSWLSGWRNVTNATNERTGIFAIFPLVGVGHSLPIIYSPNSTPRLFSALLACQNSLVCDFVTRLKIGGVNYTFGILYQQPVLPPSAYDEAALAFIVPRVLELTYTSHAMAPFARDLGHDGPPFAWDEPHRAQLRAELDAWYALAYGLSRDELRYVLDPRDVMGPDYPSETFRVLQNNELRRHGEYRTRRLVLAAYDALIAQGLRPRTEGYR